MTIIEALTNIINALEANPLDPEIIESCRLGLVEIVERLQEEQP